MPPLYILLFVTETYMVLSKGGDIVGMNINKMMGKIVDICVIYYIEYHKRFLDEIIIVSDDAKTFLAQKIYKKYFYDYGEDVYDIDILDFPYNKTYIADDDFDSLNVLDIQDMIIDFMDRDDVKWRIKTIPINVISLSNHPLNNFICINDKWIKWILDFYRY